MPVFIWIHGGSRSATDAGLDGSNLVKRGNILVVTVEYRQGALGWLKADSLGIPGNMALQDLLLSLSAFNAYFSGLLLIGLFSFSLAEGECRKLWRQSERYYTGWPIYRRFAD